VHHGCVAGANEGGEGRGGVVADVAKLSVGREAYYTRELATDHQAYLSGHGESPGRWYGAGASSLGLQGEASVAGLQRMFEGRNPDTGELLGRPHGRGAVPAFDVVLWPTKSVSVLYGLGDAATGRAVLEAHHAGVRDAATYLDGHLGARRGHGRVQHVQGQGLLAVGLTTGRPVRAIRCCTPTWWWPTASKALTDGGRRWTAGTCTGTGWPPTPSTGPPASMNSSGHFGVEWTPADSHGNRELAGMPEGLVRGFSKRTGQIDAELDRLVGDGRERTPRLVKWTVQATRKPKQHEPPDTLNDRWRTEAAERGHDTDALSGR
jgi:hypothetical protein